MSRKVLALDIQSNRVCAVLVKSSLRESRIAAFRAVAILPEREDGGGGLRAALETITETMDLDGTDCVVSLPAVFFSWSWEHSVSIGGIDGIVRPRP